MAAAPAGAAAGVGGAAAAAAGTAAGVGGVAAAAAVAGAGVGVGGAATGVEVGVEAGITLVHFAAQCKHVLWDTLCLWVGQ